MPQGKWDSSGSLVSKITPLDHNVVIRYNKYVEREKPSKKKDRKIRTPKDTDIKKREVNASVEEKTQWKISIFSEYITES
jgi:hypothetical protein